jgi:protein-S-isoprenylcysteine O-methyltransferase Ste14
MASSIEIASVVADRRPRRLRAGGNRFRPGNAAVALAVATALAVSCCVSAPAAVVATARLTLSAAVGLAVGLILVVGACVLHAFRRSRVVERGAGESPAAAGCSSQG